jgi:hypothetical protein
LAVLDVLVLGAGIGLQYVGANRKPGFTEINAEKIHFWSQPEAYRPAASTLPQASVPAQPAVAESPPAQNRVCLSVENMSQANFQDMQALLKASSVDEDKCSYGFDKKLAWWVFWPPEYEAAQRDKVLQSIHAAGVKDVLPINQGAMAQAFSVGVFVSGSQARQYRNSLRSKGLDKIEYGPRPGIGAVRLGCQMSDPGQLSRFKAALPAWAKPVDESKCPAFTEAKPQSP